MKIVLDAGHGLNTAGKRSPNGMREHEFNSAVANYARDVLKNYEGVEVLFAHDPTGKVDIPLKDRTDFANKQKADVFVSIHGNAFGNGGWNDANGIDTFVYTTNPKGSRALADIVQKKLIEMTGRKNRGVKLANFAVLRETKMDAILCELGFMTNQTEAALQKTADYRIKCAYAIVAGLVERYKLKAKPKPVEAPKAAEKPASKVIHRVQVGAFADVKNAERLVAELKAKGYEAFITK